MEFLDILITVIIIAVVLVSNVAKLRKKIPSQSETQVVSEPDWDEGEQLFEGENDVGKWASENEKIETNSSKFEPYFTYEAVSDQNEQDFPPSPSPSSNTHEINLQEVENETETTNLDLHDPEELKKAVLYGEILKNPYN